MFRISQANLIGACFGFLLYATISSMINHITTTQNMQVPIELSPLQPSHSQTEIKYPNPALSASTANLPTNDNNDPNISELPSPPLIHEPIPVNQVQSSVSASTVAGCSKSTEVAADFCDDYARKNGIIPQKTDVLFDKKFMKFKQQWVLHNCDNFFKHKLICTVPVPKCTPTELTNADFEQQPLIAILAATTTRRVKQPAIHKIALFTLLLPSLVRTLDCGFRYVYVMGYDTGDGYYDNEAGLEEVKAWFSREIEQPMRNLGIHITLATVRVDNKVKKPGPVFLAMARHAYSLGADFFYRVNDDTEFRGHWPKAFTGALMSLPPPYGVIGPASLTSNLVILTHDFVHRTHMDIMQLDYYPVELPDWWMDNWISRVYGSERTFYSEDAVVMHHTYAHGQRYEVNRQNQKFLPITLMRGRRMISAWMRQNNVSAAEVKEFEKDQSFKETFKFTEIKTLKVKHT